MIYPFVCETCGKNEELWMKVSEYKRPSCCGKEMKRIFSSAVVSDLVPYLDENIGTEPTWVKSKQHKKQLLRDNGVSEKYGKGWI